MDCLVAVAGIMVETVKDWALGEGPTDLAEMVQIPAYQMWPNMVWITNSLSSSNKLTTRTEQTKYGPSNTSSKVTARTLVVKVIFSLLSSTIHKIDSQQNKAVKPCTYCCFAGVGHFAAVGGTLMTTTCWSTKQ